MSSHTKEEVWGAHPPRQWLCPTLWHKRQSSLQVVMWLNSIPYWKKVHAAIRSWVAQSTSACWKRVVFLHYPSPQVRPLPQRPCHLIPSLRALTWLLLVLLWLRTALRCVFSSFLYSLLSHSSCFLCLSHIIILSLSMMCSHSFSYSVFLSF